MEKEELLKRSRQENKKGDEYQDLIQMLGATTGAHVVLGIMGVLWLLDFLTPLKLGGEVSIGTLEFPFRDFVGMSFCLYLAGSFGFRAWYDRKKWQMALAVFFTLGFCMGIYRVFLAG